jgi:hypothetical protein
MQCLDSLENTLNRGDELIVRLKKLKNLLRPRLVRLLEADEEEKPTPCGGIPIPLFNTGCHGTVFVRPGSKVFRYSIKGPAHLQSRISNVLPNPSLAQCSDRGCPAAESTQGLEIGGRL